MESGFKNYNNHDKVSFHFNNTDSYISRLADTFVFQVFESERKMIINYIIQLYWYLLNFLCLLLYSYL